MDIGHATRCFSGGEEERWPVSSGCDVQHHRNDPYFVFIFRTSVASNGNMCGCLL